MREIITSLEGKGIQTRAIWGLINEQKPYRSFIAYKIEKAKMFSDCILNIPCSTQLSQDEIATVAREIKSLLPRH